MFPVAFSMAPLLIGATDRSAAQNLIRDSGFEQGNGTAAEGWYGTTNAQSASFVRTSEQASQGAYSGKLVAGPGDLYARWVHSRADLFRDVKPGDRLRLRFRYMASATLGDALVQINTAAPPGYRQYTLKPLTATAGEWRECEAELVVDVVPNGSGEVQLRGTTSKTGDQVAYFDDVSLEVIGSEPPPKPLPFPHPTGKAEMITPAQLTAIQCDTSALPMRTAAEELRGFIVERRADLELAIGGPPDSAAKPAPGTLVLGTPDDHPTVARWARQSRTAITECSETTDAYEIAVVEGCPAVVGANPRAVLYGVFELEDLLVERGGLPKGFRSRAQPGLQFRLLHPRAHGGFHGYTRADFEFIARAGANVAHLSHDWMGEKTLFSFVPCDEFPNATDPATLEHNRSRLNQYIEWSELYGLDVALWLCETVCQGGPWVPEPAREAFLTRFPQDALQDTGTYQGKVLCLAHPLVERAYREMTRRLLTDFPQVRMVLVFTHDSNGEFCDPERCPRHKGVSKYTQYNRFLALLLEEGRKVRSDFQAFSIGWGWHFRDDPEYLAQLAELPDGAGLTALPDGEAWSFDRKLTDRLVDYRTATREHAQSFLGYDIFLWGDDCRFPETELYDFPLGVAAKLRRWSALRVDGFFDQWGTQAEYVANNAIALRQMLFHRELTAPHKARGFARGLARRQYGEEAAPRVASAWEEIEAAQQVQSDHTNYWHYLRPNWAGPALESPLSAEALSELDLRATEPPKPYGDVDYCPHSGDDVTCARALGEALPEAADHFARAAEHLQAALGALDPGHRSLYEHWYPAGDTDTRMRLTPRQSLEKQLVAVQTHERVQRQLGWFFAAYGIVHEVPSGSEPGRDKALERLKGIRESAGR